MRTMKDSMTEMGMQERPAGSKTLDEAAINDPELVNMVEENITNAMEGRTANLNKITGRVPGKNPAALDLDDDDSTPDDDKDVEKDDKDDDQAVSDVDDDDSTPEKDEVDEKDEKDEKGKEKDEVGIPDAYIRAAVHNGWAEEDVDALVKANPELATKTFENLYNSTNKASREWAAIGRAAKQKESKVEKPDETDKLEYGHVDLAALKKEFDLDPAVERMIESSNARDTKLTDALNTLIGSKANQSQDTTQVDQAAKNFDVAAEAAMEQQVNGFFATESMDPYKKFYGELKFGETWENLPPGQARSRAAVYKTADQLLAGAAMQAQPMELGEALERAHLLVTDGMRTEAIRSGIKKTATKRRNSMVFRASDGKSKSGTGDGKPKTKGELEQKVAGFIQKALKA